MNINGASYNDIYRSDNIFTQTALYAHLHKLYRIRIHANCIAYAFTRALTRTSTHISTHISTRIL